jgi:hypothetical protein
MSTAEVPPLKIISAATKPLAVFLCSSFRLSQLAAPRANIATPAIRAIVNTTGPSSDEPSNILARTEGKVIIIKPVPASIAAVTVNRVFKSN